MEALYAPTRARAGLLSHRRRPPRSALPPARGALVPAPDDAREPARQLASAERDRPGGSARRRPSARVSYSA